MNKGPRSPLVAGLLAALVSCSGAPAAPGPAAPTELAAAPTKPLAAPVDTELHLLPPALMPPCEASTLTALDAEGRLLVTVPWKGCYRAPNAGVVRLWDARAGVVRGALPPTRDSEEDVALSSSGARLAVASRKSVTVWDLATRKELARIQVPTPAEWFKLWFVPGSESLLTWDEGFGSKVIHLDTKSVELLPQSTISTTSSAAIQAPITTPRGKHLLARLLTTHEESGSAVTTWIRLAVFDLDTGAETATVKLTEAGTLGVPSASALRPDGEAVAIAYEKGDLEIWDLRAGARTSKITAHPSGSGAGRRVEHLVWAPNGKMLVTWGVDKALRSWDATTGAKVAELGAVKDLRAIQAVAASPDGSTRLLLCASSEARVWDPRTGKVEQSLPLPPGTVGSCLVNERGNTAVWLSGSGVATWTVGSAQIAGSRDEGWATPTLARWSPDGKHLLLGLRRGILVLDATSGHVVWSREELGADDLVVASPDGTSLAVVAHDAPSRVRLLSFATGKETRGFDSDPPKEKIVDLTWSLDSARLAVTAADVTLFEAATGKKTKSFSSSGATERAVFHPTDGTLAVFSAKFIPPSGYMPMVGNECLIEQWNPATGSHKPLFSERAAGMECFPVPPVFAPGGARLVFVESGMTLTALDVATGTTKSWSDVTSGNVAYRPDGGALGVLMSGGVARVFRSDTLAQIADLSPPGFDATAFAWAPAGDIVFLGHFGGGYLLRRSDGAAAWIRVWAPGGKSFQAAVVTSDGTVSGDADAIAHLRFHTGPDSLRGDLRTGAELPAARRDPTLLGRISAPAPAP